MEEKSKLICSRCQVALEPAEASFSYLGRSFKHMVNRCPSCGQVYIEEEMAQGKMKQVEEALEEK
jgi:hypothetical protein